MLRHFILIIMLASCSTDVMSQSEKYQRIMEEKLALMNRDNTAESWHELSNTFERIAEAEKTQWLPFYYASTCRVMKGYAISSGRSGGFAAQTDPEADKAEQLLDKAQALTTENSEILCIRKMIATLRMTADPMVRFLKYGTIAADALKKARQLDPDNPRTYLLEGQDKLFTPEQFGGSKIMAKELFRTALEKFENHKAPSSIHPHWGASQARYLLEQAN
jgi:hypothetical protein